MTQIPRDISSPRQPTGLKLAVSATLVAWLGGCATTPQPDAHVTAPVPPQYADWFDGGQPRTLEWMHKNTVEKAQQLLEQGRSQQAIAELETLMQKGLPKGYYEMAKIFDQGLGVPADPARAASLYAEAIKTPSYITGNASLNLAKLYREGRGVERNDVLAYYLIQQAIEEEVGPRAQAAMAELLVEGGDGVQADPEQAAALYRRAAEADNGAALEALAKAHGPGGWLAEDRGLSSQYAQRYTELLEQDARAGDVGAMNQLAGLFTEDGLMGHQPQRHMHWLNKAAEAGDPGALSRAGRSLVEGNAPQRGQAMLEQAALDGNVSAMETLGKLLLEGNANVAASPERAQHWLSAAIAQGSVDAQVTLGRALLDGDGLPPIPAAASSCSSRPPNKTTPWRCRCSVPTTSRMRATPASRARRASIWSAPTSWATPTPPSSWGRCTWKATACRPTASAPRPC